jgi:uncharacterized tellurite resistance protein B-like protein
MIFQGGVKTDMNKPLNPEIMATPKKNAPKKQKRRISHFKNLVLMAMADGNIDEQEESYLLAYAKKLNIKKEDLNKIRNSPRTIHFNPPAKLGKKIKQLYDLVNIMLADGNIHEKELSLCRKMALKLNIIPEVVDEILKDILRKIAEQKSRKIVNGFSGLRSN